MSSNSGAGSSGVWKITSAQIVCTHVVLVLGQVQTTIKSIRRCTTDDAPQLNT
jgi:hypothetical protein